MNPETSNTPNAAMRRPPRRGPGPVPLYEKAGQAKRIAKILFDVFSNGGGVFEAAGKVRIDRAQLYRWLAENADGRPYLKMIQEAVRLGRETAIERAEKALYEIVTGQFQTTTETVKTGADGTTTKEQVKKQLAPNVLAQMFFLRNRQSDRWADEKRLSVYGRVEVVHAIECPIPAEVVDRLGGKAPAALLLEPGSDAGSGDQMPEDGAGLDAPSIRGGNQNPRRMREAD